MNKDLTYDFFHALVANKSKVYITMEGETRGNAYTIVAFDEQSLFVKDMSGSDYWLSRAHIVKIEIAQTADDSIKSHLPPSVKGAH